MNISLSVHNLFFSSFFLLFLSCENEQVSLDIAFYHWKTEFFTSELQRSYLERLEVNYLYVKFFDVDWNESSQQVEPSAEIIWNAEDWKDFQIIPTIFITNRTLSNLEETEIKELADRILGKVKDLANHYPYQELQIDCDWTISTKEKYSQLLTAIHKNEPETLISATIRLHQVKFFEQTGVPPVDRGMLMYYNIGEIDNWESENSIFEISIAAQYINRLKEYPLELDVVLPLFNWGIVFRDEKLFKIINALQMSDLAEKERFKKIGTHRYEVVRNTYLEGHYLYKGDRIRLEFLEREQLVAASQQLAAKLPKANRKLAFYHLDTKISENWGLNELKQGIKPFITQ